MTLLGDQANERMVDRLIAEGALWSAPLIAAFRATPRHRFIDRFFHYHPKSESWREIVTRDAGPQELRAIYSDRALVTHISPEASGRAPSPVSSSSQPSLMAQMLEDLQLGSGLKVLEIGSGTGYNAALLAHAVGRGHVVSVDVDRNVLSEAWDHLRHLPERGVELQHADGREGYRSGAPYDRIMVTAATPDLEPAWLEQVRGGGLVLAPLALAPGLAYIARGSVRSGVFHGRLTRPAYFMPLRAEGENGNGENGRPPPVAEMQSVRAPWSGWFHRRRPRASWVGFIQSLAFWSLLQGAQVHYQTLATGETSFGVSRGEAVCWFGEEEWLSGGSAGQELGLGLWRSFLEAGGPRPIEFKFQAWPGSGSGPEPSSGYLRQGTRCRQHWVLLEPIERYNCP